MDSRDYRQVFAERWRVLVLGPLIGVLLGVLVVLVAPDRYSSESAVFLAAPIVSLDADQRYQANVLARDRATYYVPLLSQGRVTDDVAARVGGLDGADVAGRLTATSPPGTPLLMVSATDASPQRAQAIAGAAGDALVGLVTQVEAATGGNAPPQVVATVVQPATAPVSVAVGTVATLVLGLLVGAVAGLAVALVLQARDRSIRTVAELRTETRLPVLSVVGEDRTKGRKPTDPAHPAPGPRREASRTLRTSLDSLRPQGATGVLLLCGARGGERTTTTAVDLAAALASAGRSVVVVEADLRDPGLASAVGVPAAGGLADVLAGRATVASSLRRDRTGSFDVLVAGRRPDDPAERIGSPAMAEVLRVLGRSHRTVLVLSPPVLPVADAAAVAPLVGGVVLTVARGRTSADDVRDTLESLRMAGATVLGTVLTHGKAGARPSRPRSPGAGPASSASSTAATPPVPSTAPAPPSAPAPPTAPTSPTAPDPAAVGPRNGGATHAGPDRAVPDPRGPGAGPGDAGGGARRSVDAATSPVALDELARVRSAHGRSPSGPESNGTNGTNGSNGSNGSNGTPGGRPPSSAPADDGGPRSRRPDPPTGISGA